MPAVLLREDEPLRRAKLRRLGGVFAEKLWALAKLTITVAVLVRFARNCHLNRLEQAVLMCEYEDSKFLV
jgi:hypothetical protein